MSKPRGTWQPVDAGVPAWTYTYSFGPGIANSLAVRGADGLVVISPPCRPNQDAFTELERHGKITALVASNAFHHLGLGAWKARYPDAPLFAPRQSVARVEKQTKLSGIRPLAEAESVSGQNLELIDMPHYKTGEVLVRLMTERGSVWYVTDVIMNMSKLPAKFPFNLAFKLTKSAPGLRMNGIAPLFMVKDKKRLRGWLASEAERTPPYLLVACHGEIARLDPKGHELKQALDLS